MVHFNQSLARFAAAALDILPRHYLDPFISLINKRYAVQAPATDLVIELILRHSQDVASAINDLDDVIPRDEILVAVNQLIDKRHLATEKLFEAAHSLSDPHLVTAIELFKAEQKGEVLSEQQLLHATEAVRAFSGRGRRRLELLLLQAMLKAEHLELSDKLVRSSPYLAQEGLPPAYLVGILRCVLKNEPENYAVRRRALESSMTNLDRLRIVELDIAAGFISDAGDHSTSVDHFLKAAPASVAYDFRSKVKPFYDAHDTSLMAARTNKSISDGILGDIVRAVEEKRPLALLRLGDGESYAYEAEPGSIEDADNSLREQHWWGCQLDQSTRALLQSRLRTAIGHADYLGIPSVYRFARDTHFLTRDLSGAASSRGLVRVLQNVRPRAGANLVEERIHQIIFRRDDLKRVTSVAGARTIVISSLRPQIAADLFPASKVLTIPSHRRTSDHPAFVNTRTPLPFSYEAVLSEICSTVGKGDVVLVGGGIIGKVFIEQARQNGAVALDVGAMLDYFANAKTRSVADLL
ncbi:hypothetical protein [Hyphomicrobium sp.]|uniref:hypothetical protein n=1 Tax=Hyphomicrobium sp. TaxID=82 RepID=UPI002E35E6A2|nr:hypothetical protein [Hyphomicrobium sp.]HEX2841170.1 hypothetical protein [Hyphomicrobium sp.]